MHLLSALSHQVGMTLAQVAVDDKGNEITAVEDLLRGLVLEGRVLTMDALLTQRDIAQRIVAGGDHYVMIVKDNQRQLRADIEQVFAMVPWGDRQVRTTTIDLGHGHLEQRTLTTSDALVGYSRWPGLAQVFRIERHVVMKKGDKECLEVVYRVTSLSSERASAAQLLAWVQGHWHIENRSHWVRDVMSEDSH